MTPKQTRFLLGASLAANLFLVGLIAGAGVLSRRTPEPPRRGPPLTEIAAQLDPADADALRTLMRERAERAEPRIQALRQARREVQAAMLLPDYDPAAVRTAIARARSEELALREEVDGALIDFAARLDVEERAAVAPLLRKGGRGWRGERRGRDEASGARRPE